MSSAFLALIWWVVPAVGLTGALLYVLWVTKFESKFQQETQRSVGQFQRFQDSLRDSQARDVNAAISQDQISLDSITATEYLAANQTSPFTSITSNRPQVIKPDEVVDSSNEDNPFLKKN